MKNQNLQLNIGDEIGFVIHANGIDENDQVIFFPVVEITTRDGERAYRYQFPDGSTSTAAIRQSDLASHAVRIRKTTVETIAPTLGRMICVSERKAEFVEALQRGRNSKLEVYEDWDKDAFVVVNAENKAEYRVRLDNRDDKFFADCECPDFIYRKRVCKHIGEVLTHCLFSVAVKN